jgi:hypothetical protein
VVFNDSGTANATANLTFDKATNTFTAAGTISGGNLITGGNLSVTGDAILVGNLTVSGTTEYNNVTNLAIQDPIITLGRGANNAPLVATTTTDRGEQLWYYAGTEKSAFIGYQSSSGKLIAAAAATVTNEVVTITSAGSFVVGTLEGAVVSVTGNITGGNVLGGANVNATLFTGTTVSVTGNVTGGNVRTAGQVTATGNITGGNLITGGLVSATGTVTASQFNGSGAGLSSIPGANVTGTVANATFATSAGSATTATTATTATSATTAGTVTTAAQPNITSLGSLTSLIIPTAASDPAGSQGRFYYNTSTGSLRIYNGGFWVNC